MTYAAANVGVAQTGVPSIAELAATRRPVAEARLLAAARLP